MRPRTVAALLLTGWGAFAFGAPYPWAYWPLFVASAALGVSGLAARDGRRIGTSVRAALGAVAAIIALQLVPLPATVIRRLSPATDAWLTRNALAYASTASAHALSIVPAHTIVALCAFLSMSLLLLGMARTLTDRDASQIALGISFLGVALALVGIVQKTLWNGRLYGFWKPEETGSAFGPFNNHNHFAGWMLMAIPFAAGYFFSRLSRTLHHVPRGWRNRVLWLSDVDASQTVLSGVALLAMTLALVLTSSRSGLIGFGAAMVLCASVILRRSAAGERGARWVYLSTVAAVTVFAIGWSGSADVASGFTSKSMNGLDGRFAVWNDAWTVARRFPVLGTGVNTYGSAMLVYQTADPSVHFGEAHNDYLQLAAEGGFLVTAAAVGALLAIAFAIRRRFAEERRGASDYWVRIGAATGLVAIALQETVDFSLQMPGNAVLCAILCAIAIRPVR